MIPAYLQNSHLLRSGLIFLLPTNFCKAVNCSHVVQLTLAQNCLLTLRVIRMIQSCTGIEFYLIRACFPVLNACFTLAGNVVASTKGQSCTRAMLSILNSSNFLAVNLILRWISRRALEKYLGLHRITLEHWMG